MTRRPSRPDDATRITRVTTRIGDGGMTRLVGNREVRKDDPRLEAYGTTDELQVVMGMARDALAAAAAGPGAPALLPLLERHLVYLQQRIFTLNGELATRMEDRWENMPAIGAEDVAYMEAVIDALNRPLAPLKDFTLPGGHPAVTALHLARVVARRAERAVERLAAAEPIPAQARPFLNRLSDLFFVMGRRLQADLVAAGLAPEETIWTRELAPPPLPE